MTDPRLAGTEIADSILDLIGNTPLVRLKRISEVEGIECTLAMKAETTNPGGSSKDRPALEMILAAERDGHLRPGGTIVEPTSGNTGVGLAIVAAQRGYRCVFVMTDKVAPEKISLLEAYGAEVVVCPVAVEPDDPQSYYKVAERLTFELRRLPARISTTTRGIPIAHVKTTGTRVVATDRRDGSPTSSPGRARAGRITGTGRYLKSHEPGRQDHRRRSGGFGVLGGVGSPLSRRGRGRGLLPGCVGAGVARRHHRHQRRGERSSRPATSARAEGILIGGSGGMAVAAAIKVAKQRRPRRHRRGVQPRFRARVSLPRVQRRLDGQLRIPDASATSASAPVLEARNASIESLLYVNPHQLGESTPSSSCAPTA